MEIETAYIPHTYVYEFLHGEQRDLQTTVKWNISKNLTPLHDVKKLTIKNHLEHIWIWFQNL